MAMSVTYGNFGGSIAFEDRGGTVSHYIPDCQGSTIAILGESGAITDTYDYWSYGEERVHVGSSATRFTFLGGLGYLKDVPNKLYYVRARYLKPELARWQTEDPLWPDEVAFGYVGNAPVTFVDLSGLQPQGAGQGTFIGPMPQTSNPLTLGRGTCQGVGIIGILIIIARLNQWDQEQMRKREDRREKRCKNLRQLYKKLCGDYQDWTPCAIGMGCDELRAKRSMYKMCAAKRQEFTNKCVTPLDRDAGHKYPVNLANILYKDCLEIAKNECGD